jgi:hypothetical protein
MEAAARLHDVTPAASAPRTAFLPMASAQNEEAIGSCGSGGCSSCRSHA